MSKRLRGQLFMVDDSDGEDPRDSVAPQDGPGRSGPGIRDGPPEGKKPRHDAPASRQSRSQRSATEAPAVVDDLTDDNIIFIDLPGEKMVRLEKRDLLDFVKKKGTEIFNEAHAMCLNEKLQTTLKDRPDTLRLGNKVKIINRYEKIWKKELDTAMNIIDKEKKDLEKILPMLPWDFQETRFKNDIIDPVDKRLEKAKKGVETFAKLIQKLRDTANV